MVDTVINGTRQSRSILGNADIPLEWPEALAMLKSTGWKIDIGPLNAAGLTTKGTDLNKGNLFSDTAAANFGLGANGTPDQAFRLLSPVIRGSYIGTSKGCSEATSKSLTLDPLPRLMFLFANEVDWSYPLGVFNPISIPDNGVWRDGSYKILAVAGSSSAQSVSYARAKRNGNTISWYFYDEYNRYESRGFNTQGTTYYYIGFC